MTGSFALGTSTSGVEVTHISVQGVWLLASDKEPRRGHYYWPDLDVDLAEEIIEHPERFPLVARAK
jgi:hypothetical protein